MHKTPNSMKRDIKFWTKYIGGVTPEAAKLTQKHFQKLGLKTKLLKSPTETELAKLFETIYMAWMIAGFQEMHRITRYFNADFDQVIDMLDDIHRADFNKPVHYPDVIGGHCLIPNTELLSKYYPSKMLQFIIESNEKRKEEVKNPEIRKDLEKIRERVEKLRDYLWETARKNGINRPKYW